MARQPRDETAGKTIASDGRRGALGPAVGLAWHSEHSRDRFRARLPSSCPAQPILLAKGAGTLPTPQPINTAPTDDEERTYLIWCPELESWEVGVFLEGRWRAHLNPDIPLSPSHWLHPPDPPEAAPPTAGESSPHGGCSTPPSCS